MSVSCAGAVGGSFARRPSIGATSARAFDPVPFGMLQKINRRGARQQRFFWLRDTMLLGYEPTKEVRCAWEKLVAERSGAGATATAGGWIECPAAEGNWLIQKIEDLYGAQGRPKLMRVADDDGMQFLDPLHPKTVMPLRYSQVQPDQEGGLPALQITPLKEAPLRLLCASLAEREAWLHALRDARDVSAHRLSSLQLEVNTLKEERNMSRARVDELGHERDTLLEELRTYRAESDRTKTELTHAHARHRQDSVSRAEADSEIRRVKAEVDDATRDKEKAAAALRKVEEKASQLLQEREGLRASSESTLAEKERLLKEQAAIRQGLERQLASARAAHEAQLAELRRAHANALLERHAAFEAADPQSAQEAVSSDGTEDLDSPETTSGETTSGNRASTESVALQATSGVLTRTSSFRTSSQDGAVATMTAAVVEPPEPPEGVSVTVGSMLSGASASMRQLLRGKQALHERRAQRVQRQGSDIISVEVAPPTIASLEHASSGPLTQLPLSPELRSMHSSPAGLGEARPAVGSPAASSSSACVTAVQPASCTAVGGAAVMELRRELDEEEAALRRKREEREARKRQRAQAAHQSAQDASFAHIARSPVAMFTAAPSAAAFGASIRSTRPRSSSLAQWPPHQGSGSVASSPKAAMLPGASASPLHGLSAPGDDEPPATPLQRARQMSTLI